MQCVYELNGLRIVDLTKYIDPATETRRCKLDRFNTGGAIPDFHTNVDIMTHLGTHCECPFTILKMVQVLQICHWYLLWVEGCTTSSRIMSL